jgi:hypothetical protein
MDEPRGAAYRDEVAAAYARINALEARAAALESEARGRGDLAPFEAEGQLVRLESEVRRWERARTTLAILLGIATLVTMHFSERFGPSVGVLVACVTMVAVGVTLAWPALSPRGLPSRALGGRPPQDARSDGEATRGAPPARVRVVGAGGARATSHAEAVDAPAYEERARGASTEARRPEY